MFLDAHCETEIADWISDDVTVSIDFCNKNQLKRYWSANDVKSSNICVSIDGVSRQTVKFSADFFLFSLFFWSLSVPLCSVEIIFYTVFVICLPSLLNYHEENGNEMFQWVISELINWNGCRRTKLMICANALTWIYMFNWKLGLFCYVLNVILCLYCDWRTSKAGEGG